MQNTLFAFTLIDQITDPKDHFVILIWDIDSTIASIYAPNEGQLSFIRSTINKI